MTDSQKTKAELIDELESLRLRVTELEQKETALKEEEQEDEKRFLDRLKILHQVTNELSTSKSVDELCKQAIELGRNRLGFDRLGMFFLDEENSEFVVGSFGTDEKGQIRDERAQRAPLQTHRAILQVLSQKGHVEYIEDVPLYNHAQQEVGRGCAAVAGLWGATGPIGCMPMDNLLSQKPITPHDRELLGLYASAVGHLYSLKRTEEDLCRERNLLQGLLENVPDDIYFKDIESRFVRVSKASAERSRLADVTELIGKTDFDFYTPEHARKALDDERRVIETGKPLVNIVEKETWPDGREAWVSTTKVPFRDEKGHIVGTLGISRDISEWKRAEEALERRERLYRQAIEVAGAVPYYQNYKTNQYEFVGEGIKQMTGYSAEEFSPKVWVDMEKEIFLLGELSGLSVNEAVQKAKQKEGVSWRADYRVRTRDGEERWLANAAIQVKDDTGEIVGSLGILEDITDRKQAEESLERSERMYRQAIEVAGAVPYYQNYQTNQYEFIGEGIHRMTGYTREEFTPKIWSEMEMELHLLGELAGLPVREAIQKARGKEGVSWRGDYRVRTKDGGERWLANAAIQVKDRQGEVIGSLGILQDITDRRHAEEEAKMSHLRLLSIFDGVDEPIYVSDPETFEILYVNQVLRKDFGEPESRTCFQYLQGRDEPCPFCTNEKIFGEWLGQSYVWEFQNKLNRRWYRCIDKAIQWPDGRMVRCEMAVDITESKRVEAQLQRERDLVSRIMETSPAGITMVDRDGRIVFANAMAEQMHGLERSKIAQRTYNDPEWRITDHDGNPIPDSELPFQRVMRSGKPVVDVRHAIEHPDGRRVLLSINAAPLFDETGEVAGLVSTVEDVTERLEMEEQLRQSQKMQAIGQLAGGVAHDFNNLLTGIIGNLALAEMDGTPEIEKYIRDATDAADRARRLVKQLLAFSRKTHIELKPTDLNELANEMYRLVRETVDRRIDIEIDTQEQIPPVLADATQLSSVLMNLCVNARDAVVGVMDADAVPERRGDRFAIIVSTRTTVVDAEHARNQPDARLGRYVVVSVSDNGTGMDEQTRRHIFEPFFTTKDVGQGTGLGLASAYGIVKQHNGWIEVQSELGIGSSFQLYFPVLEQTPQRQEEVRPEELPTGSETILLVDDEEMLRDVGKSILERLGYTVILAQDGEQALEMVGAERDRIDLIILDLSMPRMSGREVLETFRGLGCDTPVIVSSGYAEDDQREPLDRLGVAAYISKPYRPTKFANTVREVLDSRQYSIKF